VFSFVFCLDRLCSSDCMTDQKQQQNTYKKSAKELAHKIYKKI